MLQIKDVFKTFNAGTINEKVALKGVNLHLKPGDFVTVIGGNGAGKSTMLNSVRIASCSDLCRSAHRALQSTSLHSFNPSPNFLS